MPSRPNPRWDFLSMSIGHGCQKRWNQMHARCTHGVGLLMSRAMTYELWDLAMVAIHCRLWSSIYHSGRYRSTPYSVLLISLGEQLCCRWPRLYGAVLPWLFSSSRMFRMASSMCASRGVSGYASFATRRRNSAAPLCVIPVTPTSHCHHLSSQPTQQHLSHAVIFTTSLPHPHRYLK
ncbi:hypothetical protein K491DRAFT_508184 [Lophiostoma macrostomum CBS 122681]|uniref:Uncharacterized protein n=1 Tax=Lophiostoma macrostomum CBS 122681 TaxID=1314788 RepID=A0A6A6T1M1_9PLEO|nr:hypothetical protein K491DRAFT_508184 [Lophiostoma macrostomum CBS 122681]